MKKVALVTAALNIGGTETVILGLARALKGAGLEPSFVITDAVGPWHNKPLDEGFSVHSVLQSSWHNRFQHARAVAACLKQFDVVLLNCSKIAQSSLGLLPETTSAISIVHNDNEVWYKASLSNRANIDAVVTVSEHLRKQSLLRGMPAEQVRFIRNGTQVLFAFPKATHSFVSDDPLRIAFVGRIEHEQKGVLYLPGILTRLAELGVRAALDIIGTGRDLAVLRGKMDASAMTNNCTYHGGLSHEKVLRIVSAADVLIMPSHYEGQGVVIFEAMARGVVPIVSNLKDVTDAVIEDGIDGFLVKVGDEAGFAKSLSSLANDRKKLMHMAHMAWLASKKFSVEEMAGKYLALMLECHKQRARGSMPHRTGVIDASLLGHHPNLPKTLADIGYSLARRMSFQ
jgi:glycosyltransferase involved in cell wall biosynthesis